MSLDPARERWTAILEATDTAALCADLAGRMREARLTFGGRLLCPFLRPFFISPEDETRVARAAETLAVLAERLARAALEWPALFDELGVTDEEERLARIDPGYPLASTASRADAFLLPGTLQFAEYNAESPAGPGYSHLLADVFAGTSVMESFRESFEARRHPAIDRLLDALVTSYRDWGGRNPTPRVAIVDWREVPTWSEFEILRDAFVAAGVPTTIADPRDLSFDGSRLVADGQAIDLVYRRVLVSDIVSRTDECRALVAAYAQRAVCLANTLRCKLPHKKTFFAVLTDERFSRLVEPHERELIRAHVPWTRRVREGASTRDGQRIDLLEHARAHRERLVLKPSDEYGGAGVLLGWETGAGDWDRALSDAAAAREPAWIVQERIAVRREPFPICTGAAAVEQEMLVDVAPFLFRGRLAGYLTRLSATGLANVTSGGGQVPAFVTSPRH
jgi:uncharacterized circularly permuted ATP-grasp superfamily protein